MSTPTAGKLPGYETTFITRAEMADEGLKALSEKLVAIVGQYGGELVLTEDWGKRKLAYSIQKEARGQYTYLVYTGRGEIVHEMERNLRLHEHVLRFLTVNLEDEFEADAFRKRRTEIQAAAKRREEEREARREERERERRAERGEREYRPRYESGGPSAGPREGAAPGGFEGTEE